MKIKVISAVMLVLAVVMIASNATAMAAGKQPKCVRAPCYPTVPPTTSPLDPYAAGNVGVDVSWPNCQQTPPTNSRFGIVGITYGLPYSENPCLAQEAARFPDSNRTFYINTAWNDKSPYLNAQSPVACAGDANCLAYNYGWNNAQQALGSLGNNSINRPTWVWLDVETENTWNADTQQNRSSIQGAHDALQTSNIQSGVYSTTYQWGQITGGWLNGWPAWGATVENSAAAAATYCWNSGFTGSGFELIQFVKGGFDQDYAC
jgi:hypothetical protein